VFYHPAFGVVVMLPYYFELLSRHNGPNAAIPTDENISDYSLI
jgi:hypothetical protein